MSEKDYFKKMCKKEDIVITRINRNKVYFKLGEQKYLIYEGVDGDYELYTCLYLVEYEKRRVVEQLGFCYGHINPTSLIEIKGNKGYGKGVPYSHIMSTDKLKAKLLSLIG